jgi:hypothetical protein
LHFSKQNAVGKAASPCDRTPNFVISRQNQNRNGLERTLIQSINPPQNKVHRANGKDEAYADQ